jgi:hypothetical protein
MNSAQQGFILTCTHCGMQLCGALGNIKALRERLGEVDDGTYASACTVVALQTRRRNVAATVDMLQVCLILTQLSRHSR